MNEILSVEDATDHVLEVYKQPEIYAYVNSLKPLFQLRHALEQLKLSVDKKIKKPKE